MIPAAAFLALLAMQATAQPAGGAQGARTVRAASNSVATACAEHDNVSIFLSGQVSPFTVEATHPTYAVGADNCKADFSSCPAARDPSFPFAAGVFKLFDNGKTVVEAVREASWWRPQGMSVSVDGGRSLSGIHFIRLYEKISGENSWPQWLVLYADGNMRLIPQPPAGVRQVCFGASVVIGPARVTDRPLAEIGSLTYLSRTRSLRVQYRTGGSAVVRVLNIDRQKAQVSVAADYATPDATLAVLRSMFVQAGNADTDSVRWKGPQGEPHDKAVMRFSGGIGTEWFFYRKQASKHNRSGPDIRIRLNSTAAGAGAASVALK